MRIMLDIDGVLADFVLAFTQEAERLGLVPRYWSTDVQPQWNFKFHVDPVWKVVGRTPNWWMTLPALVDEGDVRALNDTMRNNEVYFVTSRKSTAGYHAQEQSRLWLDSVGIHVADSHGVIATKTGTKGALAAALDLDVALDDQLENLEDLTRSSVKAVARRWRYNEAWAPSVQSLREFLEGYCGWKPTTSFYWQ